MIRWLYRLLFARRAVWTLIHEREEGNIRLTLFDPDLDDLESAWESVRDWQAQGWTLIAHPKENP